MSFNYVLIQCVQKVCLTCHLVLPNDKTVLFLNVIYVVYEQVQVSSSNTKDILSIDLSFTVTM